MYIRYNDVEGNSLPEFVSTDIYSWFAGIRQRRYKLHSRYYSTGDVKLNWPERATTRSSRRNCLSTFPSCRDVIGPSHFYCAH